jgi:UDP-2-acetamido-3-amino-2,3-dideoxy-glucuronate N-acetyltransferase
MFPILTENLLCFFYTNRDSWIIKKNVRMKTKDYFSHESSYIDEGCQIGKGTKIWHFSHVMSGCKVGENCNIGQNVVVSPDVILGNGVKVQNNVSIYTGVVCEDDVFLGPGCVFTNVINPRSAIVRKDEFMATKVCRGASIGANATIICGVTIGRYAMIGAGAVVTRDIADYSLVVGNPARRSGWVSEYGHRLHFDDNGFAACPESGDSYIIAEGAVSKISTAQNLFP